MSFVRSFIAGLSGLTVAVRLEEFRLDLVPHAADLRLGRVDGEQLVKPRLDLFEIAQCVGFWLVSFVKSTGRPKLSPAGKGTPRRSACTAPLCFAQLRCAIVREEGGP